MKGQLRKRLESLAYRTGMMCLAVILDAIVQNLSGFNLPAQYTVVVGLILGEISKEIKNRYDLAQELKKY